MRARRFVTALLMALPFIAWAQEIPQSNRFRTGVLDNGLHYYICANSYVPQRADFYIVQNVGSILELPSQRGLAHFLEHMAFNGTTNFPDKLLINYLESIGVKFGANLNAYTSVDETVYMIKDVPVIREGITDSCLMVLRDWSDGILLEDTEIDKERGVIEEEWRTRDNSMMRMFEQMLPVVYATDKYVDCLPIGNIDVIRNFAYDTLRAYYKEWYRPDLQAIVVVGDIDMQVIEDKIRKMFASASVPDNASERIWYGVADNDSMIVAIATDVESNDVVIELDHKMTAWDRNSRNSWDYLFNRYMVNLACHMIDNRMEEIKRRADSPYSSVYTSYGQFLLSATKRCFELSTRTTSDKLNESLVTMMSEIERAYRYGFTPGELVRAKADLLQAAQRRYNERNNQYNAMYVQCAIDNFTEGEPIVSIEDYLQFLTSLPDDAVDMLLQPGCPLFADGNWVMLVTAPKKEKALIPSADLLRTVADSVRKTDIEPYVDDFEKKSLVGDVAVGSIRSERKGKDGVYRFVLLNGVSVSVLPTTYKDDEILFSAYSRGGMSAERKGDELNLKLADNVATIGGLGEFSEIELEKQLAGCSVSTDMAINSYTECMTGSSSVKDFETLLQLIYLQFTSLRRDDEAFASFVNRSESQLRNQEAEPMVEFSDSIISIVYGNNPLYTRVKASDLDSLNYDDMLAIVRRRFADASDFSFFIVGNVDIDSLRPLMCQYMASLPVGGRKEKWSDVGLLPSKGDADVSYRKKMVNPKTTAYVNLSGEMAYNMFNSLNLSILRQILNIVYFENVREANGGTYGVRVNASNSVAPYGNYLVTMSFDTDSTKYETLIPILYAELGKIASDGPSAEHLEKVLNYMAKSHADALQKNSYWLNRLVNEQVYNLKGQDKYMEYLGKCNAASVRKLAANILKKAARKQIIQVGSY